MDDRFAALKRALNKNAAEIQLEATKEHKSYLGTKSLRNEYINKYKKSHVEIVRQLADFLDKDQKQAVKFFKGFGEKIGRESVTDGLTLEEAIDGTIFLKQAIWVNLKGQGLLAELSVKDFYDVSQKIGALVDILSSKIAFTYHKERQYIENNLRFLAEASRILSSSLDYQTTLNTIAKLAVPEIGDWCAIDILDEQNNLIQVAVAHKDPSKVKWAKKLREKYPPDLDSRTGVVKVLKTGKAEMYPVVTDEMLVAASRNPEQLKLARQLGFKSVIIVPIFSRSKSIGAITFVTTETSRYYNEADLLMAEELANRASTAIENARLYRGSQEAISIRDEFISMASHELKTPVTSVKMFTQVLKKHSEQIGDEQAVTHLEKMDKQLNNLTELIYDLLNVSKIQAGKMEFKKQKFDLDKAVSETLEVLQQSSSKHKLIVKGSIGKKIVGDEERIGQVINNLVSNAIKYSPKAAEVVVKLSSTDEEAQVQVQDFGIGMEKAHLDKIFDRFYRVYDTTDKTFPGLGIGLYICSEIIKRHGGKLSVKSNVGKGSTFAFSLPVERKTTK